MEDRLIPELTKARLRQPVNDKRAIAFFESRQTEIPQTVILLNPLCIREAGVNKSVRSPHGRTFSS